MSTSFEQAAFALVQAMSPSKRLRMDEIPIGALKDLLSDFVGKRKAESTASQRACSQQAAAASFLPPEVHPESGCRSRDRKLRRCCQALGEDEDSRMSGTEMSEDSRLSANEEESTRSGAHVSRRRSSIHPVSSHNSVNSNSSGRNGATCPAGISLRQVKRAKRMQEMRESRRKQTIHEEKESLECTEEDFGTIFDNFFATELTKEKQTPIFRYHKILNTIRDFYSRHTWSDNVEQQTCDFLNEKLPELRQKMIDAYDQGSLTLAQRVRKTELIVLLDMHLLANRFSEDGKEVAEFKTSTSDDESPKFLKQVIADMRFIYISTDASKMKHLLEEPITDNFSQLIPRIVTTLFEELCIAVPADLDEYTTHSDTDSPQKEIFRRSESVTSSGGQVKSGSKPPVTELDRLMEELGGLDSSSGREEEKASKTSGGNANGKRRAERHLDEPRPSRCKVVPETPEEKLRRNRKTSESDEVIKATPMGKLRTGKAGAKAKKLSELVKLSEEQLARRPRAAAVASEKASRAMIQAVSVSAVPQTTKAAFLALNTPSPRTPRAKTNLASKFAKFADTPPTSKTISNRSSTQVPSKKPMMTEASLKTSKKSNGHIKDEGVTFASLGINPRLFGLNDRVIDTYDKRMAEIRRQGKRGDPLHRNRNRVNLFRATEAEAAATAAAAAAASFEQVELEKEASIDVPTPIPSPKKKNETAKSRTGRVVKQTMAVHFAHILLSSDNKDLMSLPVSRKPSDDLIIYPKHELEYTRPRDLLKGKKLRKPKFKRGKRLRMGINTQTEAVDKPSSSNSTSSTAGSLPVAGKLESSDNESDFGSESGRSEEWN